MEAGDRKNIPNDIFAHESLSTMGWSTGGKESWSRIRFWETRLMDCAWLFMDTKLQGYTVTAHNTEGYNGHVFWKKKMGVQVAAQGGKPVYRHPQSVFHKLFKHFTYETEQPSPTTRIWGLQRLFPPLFFFKHHWKSQLCRPKPRLLQVDNMMLKGKKQFLP